MKTKQGFSANRLFAKENRGLLLDVVVFVLNLFLMQRLTRYALEVFQYADEGDPLAQFSLFAACAAMWVLPAAGAVLKRWHFHQRLKASGKKFEFDSNLAGCLFNPIFYFCLNLVLVSAIIAGAGQFLVGNKLADSAAVFVPSILLGLIATILQTYLIYRYFSPPNKPPRYDFLRQPQSETLGDVCIFLNMIIFQVGWNFLALADFDRPSGVGEFVGRLLILCFLALLVYFPPRMLYLAEDIDRPRTWLTMLLANSPVIFKVLIGTKSWR